LDWRGVSANRGSAKWTVRVRVEPNVNAMGVESVVTVRKEAAFFAVGELRQADGAIVDGAVGVGGIRKGGKEFENGRAKALVKSHGGNGSNGVAVAAVAAEA